MIITIHQPQYLPWLGYFDKFSSADVCILLDNVQYKKNEWQNRNRIRTPVGWQWLTVPVAHKFGQKINAIKINNKTDWRRSHLKALELNYCKAPFFDLYFPHFKNTLDQPWESLSELNIHFIKQFLGLLGINNKVYLASEYEASEHKTLRLVDLCKHFNSDTYLSGEGGEKYLDLQQFEDNQIRIRTQKYQHPQYSQVWANKEEGFCSHLSVVDLLFNCGPKSLTILTGTDRSERRGDDT